MCFYYHFVYSVCVFYYYYSIMYLQTKLLDVCFLLCLQHYIHTV